MLCRDIFNPLHVDFTLYIYISLTLSHNKPESYVKKLIIVQNYVYMSGDSQASM